ncbi:uncharacterized protein V6R79_001240 [Siganus canaliculatus]
MAARSAGSASFAAYGKTPTERKEHGSSAACQTSPKCLFSGLGSSIFVSLWLRWEVVPSLQTKTRANPLTLKEEESVDMAFQRGSDGQVKLGVELLSAALQRCSSTSEAAAAPAMNQPLLVL